MAEKRLFSVVIPAYNEEDAIGGLMDEIKEVFSEWGEELELIIVDDGSEDSTREEVKKRERSTLIILDKNHGQSTALDAGINYASGDYIITIDGDGQNDPNEIPRMFAKLKDENLDAVCGWRKNRKDKKSKVIFALIASKLRNIILKDKTKDSGCTLKIFKKSALKGINLFDGLHRFIPALLIIKEKNIGEIETKHRPRTTGKTKYNVFKYIPGMMGFITVWKIKTAEKKLFTIKAFIFSATILIFSVIFLYYQNSIIIYLLILFSVSLLVLEVITEFNKKRYYTYSPEYEIEEIIKN